MLILISFLKSSFNEQLSQNRGYVVCSETRNQIPSFKAEVSLNTTLLHILHLFEIHIKLCILKIRVTCSSIVNFLKTYYRRKIALFFATLLLITTLSTWRTK